MIASGTCGGVRAAKINYSETQQEEGIIINGDGPGYRDLTAEDKIQLGDIFYNPEWEVGGPWYLVKKGNSAIGKPYVPGKNKFARRPKEMTMTASGTQQEKNCLNCGRKMVDTNERWECPKGLDWLKSGIPEFYSDQVKEALIDISEEEKNEKEKILFHRSSVVCRECAEKLSVCDMGHKHTPQCPVCKTELVRHGNSGDADAGDGYYGI